jgi:hypothetical protein
LCASIKPDIEVEEVPTYLIEHIELDLNMIQTALGKNKDDVLVLIHYILSQMMDLQTMAVIGNSNIIIKHIFSGPSWSCSYGS